MLTSIKIIILLAVQLNIFFLIGFGFFAFTGKAGTVPAGTCIASGFALFHGIFWIIAYPWSLIDLPFFSICILWGAVLTAFLLFSTIKQRHQVILVYSKYITIFLKHLPYWLLFFAAFLVVILVVTRSGFLDIDSQTYISDVTSVLGTGHLLKFTPSTGLLLSRKNFLRRGCSMFAAESACWCKWFDMHPLVYCRFVRASMNPILLLCGTYTLIRKVGAKISSSLQFLTICCAAFFFFDNSGYTNTRFLLHRAYEGKAYLSGTLIIFTVVLCLEYFKRVSWPHYAVLFFNTLACISISASSLFVLPPLIISFFITFSAYKKKWRYILYILPLITPSALFLLLQRIG